MHHSTNATRSLFPPLAVVPTARSGQDITSCCSAMTSEDRVTDAPTPIATLPKSQRTSRRPSSRNRSWYRSAQPMVYRKMAALYCRATSTPRFGMTSRSRKTTRSGPSSKCASSPPRPSSPKVRTLAPSIRYVPIPLAPSIIRSSQPAAR